MLILVGLWGFEWAVDWLDGITSRPPKTPKTARRQQ